MTGNYTVRQAVRRALAAGAVAVIGAGALVANAKPAPTPKPQGQSQAVPAPTQSKSQSAAAMQLQTIVVTGTLIPRPASETAAAITIISADTLKNQGLTNVEQAVDQVTSNIPGINVAQSVSTFTGGGSFADLRGLGPGRTLVLLDGHRLANNVVQGDSVDLNGIPFSAIQSMQVLREGASALYGSDAIAGVINFITKKDYQGGDVQVDINHPQQAGGGSGNVSFTWGHGSLARDGYNFMITGSYSKQQELKAQQRSFAATGYNPAQGLENLNGPFGPWPGSYLDANGNLWQTGYPTCAGNPFLTTQPGYCAYEYSAAVDLLPASSELSGLMSFTKSLPDNNTLRLQYFYTRSKVTTWGGPITYGFAMTPAADPTYYPTAAQSTCLFNVNGGPCAGGPDLTSASGITAFWTDPNNNRYSNDLNTEQRVLLTFAGYNDGWSYATTFNYSVNENTAGVTEGYPNEAVLAPNGVLSNLINPFGPQSAAGQQLINSSYLNGVYANGTLQHWSIGGHARHRLGDAFYKGHPAELAIGVNARVDRINFASTPLASTLYSALFYPPNAIHGSRQAQAVYAELYVPMSSHLDLTLSDREDRYSDFGTTNNGKLAVRYQPSRYVTFRAAASTGFRAPSLTNLYSPNTFGATGGTMGQGNPYCASGSYNAEFTQLVCGSQGMAVYGGNRHLKPETSENFDFGVIVEPLTNLGITLDYYKILIKNAIGGIPSAAIYANPSLFANQYVLNSAGSLTPAPAAPLDCSPSYTVASCGYILQTGQNTGGVTTDGFDLSAQYFLNTRYGTFRADLEGTLVTQFHLQEYTGGPQIDLLGWYNQGNQPAIRWQHVLRLGWTSPQGRWGAGVTNHFFSHYIDEYPNAAGNQRIVGNQSTWDVFTSYKPIRPLTVLFGIRNVFGQVPPFSNQTGNWPAGYNPVYSDPLLRTFYLNMNYRF